MSGSSLPPPDPPRRRRGPRHPLRWAGLAAAAVALVALVLSSSIFDARSTRVEGNRHHNARAIARLAGIEARTNVLWLDVAAAERRLEADPWIETATIRRALPSTVWIRVEERVPAALVRTDDTTLLAAGDGTVLGAAAAGLGEGLPEITGPGALPDGPLPASIPAARALGPMDAALRARVREISVGEEGRLTLHLRSGTRIRYGPPEEHERKAAAIDGVVRWAAEQGRELAVIDVRAPETPTAEPA